MSWYLWSAYHKPALREPPGELREHTTLGQGPYSMGISSQKYLYKGHENTNQRRNGDE